MLPGAKASLGRRLSYKLHIVIVIHFATPRRNPPLPQLAGISEKPLRENRAKEPSQGMVGCLIFRGPLLKPALLLFEQFGQVVQSAPIEFRDLWFRART